MKLYQTGTAKRNRQIEKNIKKLVNPEQEPIIYTVGYSHELLPSGFNVRKADMNVNYEGNLNGCLFFNIFTMKWRNGGFADYFDLSTQDFSQAGESFISSIENISPRGQEFSTINTINTLNALLKPFFLFNNSNLYLPDDNVNDTFWFASDSGAGINFFNNTLHYTTISGLAKPTNFTKTTKILPFLNSSYEEFNSEDTSLFNQYTPLLYDNYTLCVFYYTARPKYVTVQQ